MNYFPTTHWSVVLNSGQEDGPRSVQALEELCKTYWYPLYAFARQMGCSPQDAEDITQSFFEHVVRSKLVAKAKPELGKFRSFLLVSFKNFRTVYLGRSQAIKRGGKARFVSIDEDTAEARYAHEINTSLTPEKIFERSWALTVLDQAHGHLAGEYATDEEKNSFARMQQFLSKEKGAPAYRAVADELGTTEDALKMAVSRMRKRYRELLRFVVGQTVMSPSEVEEELRYLMQALVT